MVGWNWALRQAGADGSDQANATWAYPPHTASSTDPDLLRALIQMVADAGAKRIIVMDHCAIDPGTEESCGYPGLARW